MPIHVYRWRHTPYWSLQSRHCKQGIWLCLENCHLPPRLPWMPRVWWLSSVSQNSSLSPGFELPWSALHCPKLAKLSHSPSIFKLSYNSPGTSYQNTRSKSQFNHQIQTLFKFQSNLIWEWVEELYCVSGSWIWTQILGRISSSIWMILGLSVKDERIFPFFWFQVESQSQLQLQLQIQI